MVYIYQILRKILLTDTLENYARYLLALDYAIETFEEGYTLDQDEVDRERFLRHILNDEKLDLPDEYEQKYHTYSDLMIQKPVTMVIKPHTAQVLSKKFYVNAKMPSNLGKTNNCECCLPLEDPENFYMKGFYILARKDGNANLVIPLNEDYTNVMNSEWEEYYDEYRFKHDYDKTVPYLSFNNDYDSLSLSTRTKPDKTEKPAHRDDIIYPDGSPEKIKIDAESKRNACPETFWNNNGIGLD